MKNIATEISLPVIDPIELGGYTLDIDHFLKMDYVDSRQAARELPSVIEWLNSELQIAIERKILCKHAVKKAEGAAYLDLKGPLWERRGYSGKPTEAALEAAVHQEAGVEEAYRDLAAWSGLTSRLSSTMLSLQAKLDLVRTVEATRRAMLDEDPDN